ncbi:uncharacterized protein LOC116157877 [Camelus dromedarius]|uniref:uncharacterized protein LOC116157877 n=1 Tax=Camelus dromedarius TaxID=9838 RepID=UPI003119250E
MKQKKIFHLKRSQFGWMKKMKMRRYSIMPWGEYLPGQRPIDGKHLQMMKNCQHANTERPTTARVSSVQYHPRAQVVMVTGLDDAKSLFQVDGKTNPKIQSICLEMFPIFKACFSANGEEVLATSTHSKVLYVYDMLALKANSCASRKRFRYRKTQVTQKWRMKQKKIFHLKRSQFGWMKKMKMRRYSIMPWGEYLPGQRPIDGKHLQMMKNCQHANTERPTTARVSSVQYHPRAQVVMVTGLDDAKSLFQVDGKTNPKIQSICLEMFPIFKACFSANGEEVLATSTHSKVLYVYDMLALKANSCASRKRFRYRKTQVTQKWRMKQKKIFHLKRSQFGWIKKMKMRRWLTG